MINVRPPAVDGAFYPAEKAELEKTIDELLEKSKGTAGLKASKEKKLKALIVPHAGYTYSGLVAASGFNLFSEKDFSRPPRILLLGPSHQADFQGLAASSAKEWITPLGNVKIDSLNGKMVHKFPGLVKYIDEAHTDEHCLEVEIPFLQRRLNNKFTLVPLLTGQVFSIEFVEVVKTFIQDIDLIVVSTDLSHYYPYEITIRIDKRANLAIPHADIIGVMDEVEACGKIGVLTLMQLANDYGWSGVLVDYRNSGDTGGERESAVGYGCYAFYH